MKYITTLITLVCLTSFGCPCSLIPDGLVYGLHGFYQLNVVQGNQYRIILGSGESGLRNGAQTITNNPSGTNVVVTAQDPFILIIGDFGSSVTASAFDYPSGCICLTISQNRVSVFGTDTGQKYSLLASTNVCGPYLVMTNFTGLESGNVFPISTTNQSEFFRAQKL